MRFGSVVFLACAIALSESQLNAQVTVELLAQTKTLKITGTSSALGDNVIVEPVIINSVPSRIRVRWRIGSTDQFTNSVFPIDKVELIDARLGGGDDTFSNRNCSVVCNVYGENGNDTITTGVCADSIFGGNGNDTILAGDGIDNCEGGSGNDYIDGQGGDDGIFGELGVDVLIGGAGVDSLNGFDGNDLVIGAELSPSSVASVKSIWFSSTLFASKVAAFQLTPPSLVDDANIDYMGGGLGADLFLGDFLLGLPLDRKIDFVNGDRDNFDLLSELVVLP